VHAALIEEQHEHLTGRLGER